MENVDEVLSALNRLYSLATIAYDDMYGDIEEVEGDDKVTESFKIVRTALLEAKCK